MNFKVVTIFWEHPPSGTGTDGPELASALIAHRWYAFANWAHRTKGREIDESMLPRLFCYRLLGPTNTAWPT